MTKENILRNSVLEMVIRTSTPEFRIVHKEYTDYIAAKTRLKRRKRDMPETWEYMRRKKVGIKHKNLHKYRFGSLCDTYEYPKYPVPNE